MAFTVTGATRGHIDLRDGDLVAYVAGEGLIPQDPRQPCYVVYLNAIDILQGQEGRRPAIEVEKAAITDAITVPFAGLCGAFGEVGATELKCLGDGFCHISRQSIL